MGSVMLFNAARMQAIEDGTVVSGLVDVDGHLILKRHDDSTYDAGDVVGPPGTTTWDGITDRPSSFTPSAHTHPPEEVITVIAAKDASVSMTSYPTGISAFDSSTKSGWPYALGIVETTKVNTYRVIQTVTEKGTSKQSWRTWTGSDWGSWVSLDTIPSRMTAAENSITALEVSSMRRKVPSSVTKSGGGTVVLDSDGTIKVTANGPTAIQVNGVFATGKSYRIDLAGDTPGNTNLIFMYRKAGTDQIANSYIYSGIYGTLTWIGSQGVSGYGAISTNQLLMVNGGSLHHGIIDIENLYNTKSYRHHFRTRSRQGGQDTFYYASGEYGLLSDCDGFTITSGTSTFNADFTIKIWELN